MREKTALVLSAGGFFGAYQAAWKALAAEFTPDLVVGCSVGALNGWAIAARCPPGELIDQWLHPDTGSLLAMHPNGGVRHGYFRSDTLRQRVEILWATYRPTAEYGLVLVTWPWLRTRLVSGDHVRPEHLLATCSIPILFPAVGIGGKRFVDGGFLEILPLWAAVEMGATRVIAVHSLPALGPWWMKAGIRCVRLLRPGRGVPRDIELRTISPTGRMGTARDAVTWNRDNIERWIRMGERDARQPKACATGLQ